MDARHHFYQQPWTTTELVLLLEAQGYTVIGPDDGDGWRVRTTANQRQTISRASAEQAAQRLLDGVLADAGAFKRLSEDMYSIWWSPSRYSRAEIARWGTQGGYRIVMGKTLISTGLVYLLVLSLALTLVWSYVHTGSF